MALKIAISPATISSMGNYSTLTHIVVLTQARAFSA
jgi:hypothetical protein